MLFLKRFLLVGLLTISAPVWGVDYVVHLSLDGLGAAYLEPYLLNDPATFPNFMRLKTEGAFTFNARCDFDISETVPNHACLFTGRPALQPPGLSDSHHHGYVNNFPGANDTFHKSGNTNVPYKASFFDVAHDHGLSTTFYASKTRLTICDRSYDATNGAPDTVGTDNGKDKIDSALINDGPIADVFNALMSDLTNAPRNYSFLHCMEPDITGHADGWGSPTWSNQVVAIDAQIGRIFAAIASNPLLTSNTALIITADHGGGGANSPRAHTNATDILNYKIPFFLWGPGIPAGVELYSYFANRADPGTARPDYSASPQPIRGGDSGNIALRMLGLPPIPGSYMIPIPAGPHPPVISQHPADRAIHRNKTVALGVYAAGQGVLQYQWFKNEQPLLGKTNATYQISNTTHADGGEYFVIVSNEFGSVTSKTAQVTILLEPRITQHPQDLTLKAGSNATLTVSAEGAGILRYQWKHNGSTLPGKTQPTLIVTNIQEANAGYYKAEVSDDFATTNSASALLDVLVRPFVVQHPNNQSVVEGEDANFSISAAGSLPITYSWRLGTKVITNMVANSHTCYWTLRNVQLTNAGTYRVGLINGWGSAASLSQGAILTVLSDTDHDGIPDEWEDRYGLKSGEPLDAELDTDNDGMSNRNEYRAGTDPTDPASYLRIERIAVGAGAPPVAEINFLAQSNRTYAVDSALEPAGPWVRFADILAVQTNRSITLHDALTSPADRKFYRLSTPRTPN